ncbi:hypothetical protein RD792_007083, partial [Penstemon davidsonii]
INNEEKASKLVNIQVKTEKGLQIFTFKQLHSATGGFAKSNVIGHGAFGLVYRGVLQNGKKIAVKLMDQAGKQGEDEFTAEALPQLTDRDKVVEIMDPALEGQYSMKEVIQVAAIAAMCVQPEADYRPLMADVVQSLVPLVKLHRSLKPGACPSFQATQSPKA